MTPPYVKLLLLRSFRSEELPSIETIKDVVKLSLALSHSASRRSTRSGSSTGSRPRGDALHRQAQARQDAGDACCSGLPEFVVKVALSHWYLQENEEDYPLVTEFSFGFDATAGDDKEDDRLEKSRQQSWRAPTACSGTCRTRPAGCPRSA